MKNRIISLVLAISTCLSMMVLCAPFAGATLAPSVGNLPAVSYQYAPSVGDFDLYKQSMGSALSAVASPEVMMDMMEHLSEFEFNEYGEVSLEELQSIQYSYNNNFLRRLYRWIDFNPTSGFFTTVEITEIPSRGILRLVDDKTGQFIADWKGNYPFVRVAGDVSPQNNTVYNNNNKWVRLDNLSDLPGVVIVTETELGRMCGDLNTFYKMDCSLYASGEFKFIKSGRQSFYANFAGKPYVCIREDANTATDLVRPPVTEDNIVIENNNGLVIDRNEGTLNLPLQIGDTIGAYIENMEFDCSSPSYTLNVSIPVDVGGVTVNYNYTYNIEYNITNTYITYIGSNEPYEREEYELYYQLPDGRSSADLTAEEVAGMSFEFYDIVNYARSTDNVSVRGLYHFDGNLDDASYFSGQNSGFVWTEGASITYMDAGAFDGALYLDNAAHSFEIYAPSAIGTKDFTVQFRHYQASEIDTLDNAENSLSLGISTILTWDENSLYYGGSKIAELPVGTWHEIAIMRSNGVLSIYLNGLRVCTANRSDIFSTYVRFALGNTSRAYTMIDELRILNISAADGGASYSPTVVPHDSNLVLVLPDSERPIADSYYVINGDPNASATWDFTKVLNGDPLPSGLIGCPGGTGYKFTATGGWVYDSTATYGTVSTFDGGINFKNINGSSDFSGLMLRANGYLATNTTYTVTVVYPDYSFNSFTFTTPGNLQISKSYNYFTALSSAPLSVGTISLGWSRIRQNYNDLTIMIDPGYGRSIDISYIEITPGSSSSLSAEEITCVYPSEELQPNTAAIQTVIPVNGYTVGGIRPSMPNRGDCWFPVMNNRITSVQIYTGTHWEEVNARWWTGSRWIPIYAFDINTLEDLFDIADGDSTVPLLPDQNAFLRWWQLQWLDFRSWLDGRLSELIAAVGGGGEGIDTETPDDDGNVKFSPLQLIDTILGGLLEIAKEVIVEFVSLVVDLFKMFIQALLDFVGGLVDVLSSGLTHFSTLSDGLSGIGNFVSGTYDAIPDDIQGVLTSSFVVIISVSLLAFLL